MKYEVTSHESKSNLGTTVSVFSISNFRYERGIKARHRNALGVEPKQPSFFFIVNARCVLILELLSLCVCV